MHIFPTTFLEIAIYLLTNISEGTAFLLQGLTYNETLQFENKRIAYNMILIHFLSKDRFTKKKDRILIKDLISSKWNYK